LYIFYEFIKFVVYNPALGLNLHTVYNGQISKMLPLVVDILEYVEVDPLESGETLRNTTFRKRGLLIEV